MTDRDTALTYLRHFCAGDVAGLEPLLAPDLHFSGTLHAYASAAEYLASLRSDPPTPCDHRLLSVTESGDAVAVFYEYIKPDAVIEVAQLFRFRDGRIREVLLIFDGRAFE